MAKSIAKSMDNESENYFCATLFRLFSLRYKMLNVKNYNFIFMYFLKIKKHPEYIEITHTYRFLRNHLKFFSF